MSKKRKYLIMELLFYTGLSAGVLVYAAHPSLDLKQGNISAQLDARAGPMLQNELRLHGENLRPWEFVCTKGYELQYKNVLHGALEPRKDEQSDKSIQNFIHRCLQKAEELKAGSIVFPALGTGKCGYSTKDIAVAVYEAAMYFEINNPMPALKQVIIVAPDDNYHSEISTQLLTRHCTKLWKVGEVLVRAVLLKMGLTAVMADCMIVFWEQNHLLKCGVQDEPFLTAAGLETLKCFPRKRDEDPGKMFQTPGGHYYPKCMVHVPYIHDESKLDSTFQDGITEANKLGCQACILYFRKYDPMLSYKEKLGQHILKAIENLSGKLSHIKCIVVVFEVMNQHYSIGLRGTVKQQHQQANMKFLAKDFSGTIKATSLKLAPVQQIIAAKKLTTVKMIVKFIGHQEKVERAVKEFDDKIAQLQKRTPLLEEPPLDQSISDGERGILDDLQEKAVDAFSVDVIDSYGAPKQATKTDTQMQADSLRAPETSLMACKSMKFRASDEQTKIEHSGEPDSQRTDTWDSTMLIPDEKDCLFVEVMNIDDAENFGSLCKIILQSALPVKVPNLIYPFENKQKALLICQSQKDADKLNGIILEKPKLTFRKFNPQFLQKVKIAIPEKTVEYLRENGLLQNCLQQLCEVGVVEHLEPDFLSATSVFVTVFTMSQIQILHDRLQHFVDTFSGKSKPITSSLANMQEKYPESDIMGFENHDHTTGWSITNSIQVEKIQNVNEMLWKVFKRQKSSEIMKLKSQEVNINFESDCILIEGHTDQSSISQIMSDLNNLKKFQFEEIKPVKERNEAEYVQWCSDAKDAVGKECCVYDEEYQSFIAFGEDYDDIAKIKHLLNIKQDVIKQTGRRKNRNFVTATPQVPDIDSNFTTESSDLESMSFPKYGCLDFNWSKDASQIQEYTTNEGIKVYVYVADILRLPVDCIVNAANSQLEHGGGVAWVIAKAAGWNLTAEGNEYIRKKGSVPVGKACTTTAGKLPYACVIHAVGPRWSDFSPHKLQDVKDCELFLQNAILSSFVEAERENLKTIALPAISSAIFGVPEEMCVVQYAKAILKYSSGSASNNDMLKEIHFIDKNSSIVQLIQNTFKTMIEEKRTTDYDTMKYVTDKRATNRDIPGFVDKEEGCEIHAVNGSKVYIYLGNILEAYKKHISSIVCADDHYGSGRGGLAKALMKRAGVDFDYPKDKNIAFKSAKPIKAGQVVYSAGKGTGYENIIHAVLWAQEDVSNQKAVVLEAYKNVLHEISWRKLPSAAIPLLGTGLYRSISLEDSVEAFLDAFLDYSTTTKSDHKLTLYLMCKDTSVKTKAVSLVRHRLQKVDRTPETIWKKSEVDSSFKENEAVEVTDSTCAVCLENISSPKTLPCSHVFCVDCIDRYLDNYKKACPTCGQVCGEIIGDQPDGTMDVVFQKHFHCSGYEKDGRIHITYNFPSGLQKDCHPHPKKFYNGITRIAYLPDNKEGREILELLKIAFKRKLVFTIGRSRTTGKEDVITWNDIHHKTNPNPYGNFGYPDRGYFERVKDELAVKGVTINDIPQPGDPIHERGSVHGYKN